MRIVSIKDFRVQFKTNADCYQFLIDQKWGFGFKCRRCGCTNWYKGRQWFYRRFSSCRYDEPATANTLFHKSKLGILKSFEFAFRVSVKKKGMSTVELAKEFDCQQKSAWLLKAKLQNAMKSSEKHPLQDSVEVDEFLVGGFDESLPGRSNASKQLVVLGVEKVVDKYGKATIGRAYAKVITNGSTDNLKPFFEEKISKDASIKTDGWRGYLPLKKDWKLEQEMSVKGKNFKELHTHIMNIKLWLRGIHHKCKGHRLQNYLDEFHFRFNRRAFTGSILEKLLIRAVQLEPITHTQIIKSELNT